jgi:cardiolipin synthase
MLPKTKSAEKIVDNPQSGDSVTVLDGGGHAFPRMLDAIREAQRLIHLEVYAFALDSTGHRFIQAMIGAARRGVAVTAVIDGWGSLRSGRSVASQLRQGGCDVTLFNPLRALLAGQLRRNHRKLLLVDDAVVFIGGINIGDEYADGERLGWVDLALEVKGPSVVRLRHSLRGLKSTNAPGTAVKIFLSGRGGGRKLLKRYLRALRAASNHVLLAHAYFLPNRRLIRSLTSAARRGVRVVLLLAGQSDVPFAHAATMRLYRKFLTAGVEVYEWNRSVLHAKAAAVDGRIFLVGSFNLDPLSLANLEALVEVREPGAVMEGEQWIESKIAQARRVDATFYARPWIKRWLTDVIGLWAARGAEWIGRLLSEGGRPRRTRRRR